MTSNVVPSRILTLESNMAVEEQVIESQSQKKLHSYYIVCCIANSHHNAAS